ncbi:hypothetical protein AVEN_194894-1 [Araneus ventricosus]|uniref:Uncharacterized protein n=1 Tax=Araneus ventricosus TaxID=182803 RepID=A0A4Y2B3T1_ARAVE|nr:hypothetical protein AVEN_194894-1 [Araneus ventricosus]
MIAVQLPLLLRIFPKQIASQDILEEMSPLPSSSNKDRKRKNEVQVRRSKLITPRTSKEDLKMKAKMGLKSEEEKRKGRKENHCIICTETFEEDWIHVGFVKEIHENVADLEGNNLFINVMFILPKKFRHRIHLTLKRIFKFSKTDNFLFF